MIVWTHALPIKAMKVTVMLIIAMLTTALMVAALMNIAQGGKHFTETGHDNPILRLPSA